MVSEADRRRQPEPGMDTVSWYRTRTPEWMRQMDLAVAPGASGVIYVVLSAQDRLTCIDRGRRLRQYLSTTEEQRYLTITSADSAVVAHFLERERLPPNLLYVADRPIVGSSGGSPLSPPALTVHAVGGDSVDAIALKWTVADTASIRGLLARKQNRSAMAGQPVE